MGFIKFKKFKKFKKINEEKSYGARLFTTGLTNVITDINIDPDESMFEMVGMPIDEAMKLSLIDFMEIIMNEVKELPEEIVNMPLQELFELELMFPED